MPHLRCATSRSDPVGPARSANSARAFLISYAARIGERLEEAASQAVGSQADDRLSPCWPTAPRVVETFQKMYRHTVQKSVSVTNGAGWHAGRAAADRADLSIERRAVSA
jgi:hypothetical protein